MPNNRRAGSSQIKLFSEACCVGCGCKRRIDTASTLVAARSLHNLGWLYRERPQGWCWCCRACNADLDRAAAHALRVVAFPESEGRRMGDVAFFLVAGGLFGACLVLGIELLLDALRGEP